MTGKSPLWPESDLPLAREEIATIADAVRPSFLEALAAHRIESDLEPLLASFHVPLAAWIDRRARGTGPGHLVGLCGGQGSGKSTVTDLVSLVLREGFHQRVASFSIDDIYLERAERERLAREVHPLFLTRGVPGTHDVSLGLRTIDALAGATRGERIPIPSFDKATDDRRPSSDWPTFEGPADVVLMEGWCVGARPASGERLVEPINRLEREEDHGGTWRHAVDEALRGPYRELFGRIDSLVLLAVPGMEKVFEWRRLQERKLRESVAASSGPAASLRVMSDDEVDRFVMHYERITRRILDEMPQRADLVVAIGDGHAPARVTAKR